MSKITLQFIADELGLSKYAISRALSGKSGVSKATRQSVRDAAQRLGYVPRAERGDEPTRICALLPDEAVAKRELWLEIRNGLELQASHAKFAITFAVTGAAKDIRRLMRSCQGFVMVGPQSPEVLDLLLGSGLPCIGVADRLPPLTRVNQIRAADTEAGTAVAELLVNRGHRDMVFVHGKRGYPGRDRRLEGFRRASQLVDGVTIREISFSEDYAPLEFRPRLASIVADGFCPSAFFCGTDGIAVTVLGELQRLGISVPDECSVVGYGDYPVASQVVPALTTVSAPFRQMGMEAVRMLEVLLTKRSGLFADNITRVSVIGTLIEGSSLGDVAAMDWMEKLGDTVGR